MIQLFLVLVLGMIAGWLLCWAYLPWKATPVVKRIRDEAMAAEERTKQERKAWRAERQASEPELWEVKMRLQSAEERVAELQETLSDESWQRARYHLEQAAAHMSDVGTARLISRDRGEK